MNRPLKTTIERLAITFAYDLLKAVRVAPLDEVLGAKRGPGRPPGSKSKRRRLASK
jgi:hypothetical protein